MLAIGQPSPPDSSAFRNLEILDLATGKWTEHTSGLFRPPIALLDGKAIAFKNEMWVFGGTRSDYSVLIFNPISGWRTAPAPPSNNYKYLSPFIFN